MVVSELFRINKKQEQQSRNLQELQNQECELKDKITELQMSLCQAKKEGNFYQAFKEK